MLNKLNAVELELVCGGLTVNGNKRPAPNTEVDPVDTSGDISQNDDRGDTYV